MLSPILYWSLFNAAPHFCPQCSLFPDPHLSITNGRFYNCLCICNYLHKCSIWVPRPPSNICFIRSQWFKINLAEKNRKINEDWMPEEMSRHFWKMWIEREAVPTISPFNFKDRHHLQGQHLLPILNWPLRRRRWTTAVFLGKVIMYAVGEGISAFGPGMIKDQL